MEQKELSELTDQELLEKAKKLKSSKIMHALLVGIMAGIIIYSAVNDTISIFTFVPLFFIVKIVKDSKKNKALEELLKQRNLKQ